MFLGQNIFPYPSNNFPFPILIPLDRSVQMIFSSGKTVASICMACLIDRGLLNYNDRVSRHWPEFAQNGKENLKICDILRYTQLSKRWS